MISIKEQKDSFRKLPSSKRKQALQMFGSFSCAFKSGLVVFGSRSMMVSPNLRVLNLSPEEYFDMFDSFSGNGGA